ncbi:hypothetical protein MRX96_058021 [Rhipicephalus microplus]
MDSQCSVRVLSAPSCCWTWGDRSSHHLRRRSEQSTTRAEEEEEPMHPASRRGGGLLNGRGRRLRKFKAFAGRLLVLLGCILGRRKCGRFLHERRSLSAGALFRRKSSFSCPPSDRSSEKGSSPPLPNLLLHPPSLMFGSHPAQGHTRPSQICMSRLVQSVGGTGCSNIVRNNACLQTHQSLKTRPL